MLKEMGNGPSFANKELWLGEKKLTPFEEALLKDKPPGKCRHYSRLEVRMNEATLDYIV
jgi:hypothetical protein